MAELFVPINDASAISYDGSDVAAALGALENETAFTALTLQNGYTYTGFWTETGFVQVGRLVTLFWAITIGSAPPSDTLIATLPEGSRPMNDGSTPILMPNSSGQSLRLRPDGTIRTNGSVTAAVGTYTFVTALP